MKAFHHLFFFSVINILVTGCAQYTQESSCKSECLDNTVCIDGECIDKTLFYPCQTTDDCNNGTKCINNLCVCVTNTNETKRCAAGEVCCAETGCTNLTDDNENCGICGYGCGEGLTCTNKTCRPNSVCTNGVKKCNDALNGIDICMNGKWVKTDEVCLDNQICIQNQCVVETCDPPSFRCKNGNIEYCKDHTFTTYEECTPPDICDEETLTCIEPPECDTDTMGCTEDGNIKQCIDSHWVQIQKCPENKQCNPTSFTCVGNATCVSGETGCDGVDLKSCVKGQWTRIKCPEGNICSQGACVERTCDNGETICATNSITGMHVIEVCTNNTFVMKDTPCMSGEVCVIDPDTGNATCKQETCANTYVCDGNTLMKCTQGETTVFKTCQESETCDASIPDCVPKCGNGILDDNEECDSNTLIAPAYSCASILGSHYSGTVTCTSACTVNSEDCSETAVEPPSITDWDFEQTFNAFDDNSSYSTTNTKTTNGVTWHIIAAIQKETLYMLDKTQYAVFTSKKDSKNHIQATGITKGVGTLYFDYRGWASDTGTFKITITSSGTDTEEEITFDPSQHVFQKTYNDPNITMVNIAIVPQNKTSNTGRLCIDNVRWTNAK